MTNAMAELRLLLIANLIVVFLLLGTTAAIGVAMQQRRETLDQFMANHCVEPRNDDVR